MNENRHKSLGLSDQEVLEMYETMLLARKVDERMWLLNRSGKIPFVVSCQGQEAAQVGAAFALDRTKDYVLPYYRDLGVVLAFGMTARDIMLSGFAKAEDPNSGGRQMPGHYGQKKNRIVTQSSPVTTQVPHAAGIALAGKMEKKDFVTFVTFGEGSSNQGDFHEGANFAAVHKLPVIFMCENNLYAISVPIEKQLGNPRVSDRAIGYGMPGVTVDGNDPLAVYEVVKEAADRARRGEGPTLIETLVYRFTPHSSDDDDRYRAQEEVKTAKEKDPVVLFSRYLKEAGLLDGEKEKEIDARVMQTVNEATDYAEKAPYAKPEDTLRFVYGE
ncbi:MAG: thiamine pyrophosphate-dependent dehydrogenase E1 component subunit alpha [Heyndrickxia faecalis]|jgi:2-oxoisovalerate dehydrogenase E1 component alpha subunit|uniref:thiamine pyrophosphate-dependent dehydrogenase E1 component subunit alpha n=1 Tax=Heyndrickxia TaxID=2837504 RepID=UPI0007798924|nr:MULTISPECIES: thiamine pyrophosphate-dependent dehydrogenase E1 component subunit alpha [Heyndrickxia]AVD56381.1 thiamine pyrophosphate-dependent dehydrogenase E1 component subunit alpha [Heyndrickxia coagulans]KYC64066.1 Branched-chain alpha-keto acid dehydrogenase, E1 component, alpha subunit [Heyndrickxia coagulans]KYC91630.1 Branched-chain alpha-keto acid dehydrogenase, E1 component, alpha subunit [Heyndrickxia coagulans]MED4312580.1 thiamine pyrophosphate-dependent dehydrogenase E1 comp